MHKLIIPIIFGLLLAPAFTFADNFSANPFAEPCLIQVYNTNFLFPAEGGEIVEQGNSLFFARTYLPGCENSANGLAVVQTTSNTGNTSGLGNPSSSSEPPPNPSVILDFLIGNPCYVPVFNTDFLFPAEGGAIIQTSNGNFYFVPTYMPSCTNATNGFSVIRTSDSLPVTSPPPNNAGGSLLELLIGDNCLIPVYNTDFAFPPEGGNIVEVNGQMYFAKTYQNGCQNAASAGTLIK